MTRYASAQSCRLSQLNGIWSEVVNPSVWLARLFLFALCLAWGAGWADVHADEPSDVTPSLEELERELQRLRQEEEEKQARERARRQAAAEARRRQEEAEAARQREAAARAERERQLARERAERERREAAERAERARRQAAADRAWCRQDCASESSGCLIDGERRCVNMEGWGGLIAGGLMGSIDPSAIDRRMNECKAEVSSRCDRDLRFCMSSC